MSKFFVDTPFDRWLIFDIEGKIRSISFSQNKNGVRLFGHLRNEVLNVFENRNFDFFDYSALDVLSLSEKAKTLHDFLIKMELGEVLTYSEVAKRLFGNERYRRAVAVLLKKNKFAFFVPCHRIISKRGIGGYSAGVELKIRILNWEKEGGSL